MDPKIIRSQTCYTFHVWIISAEELNHSNYSKCQIFPKYEWSGQKPSKGLLYTESLSIKADNGMVKGWIDFFTCFTRRAAHLELVQNLIAESFLRVLRRFVTRCGYPELVLSDNVGQFQLVFRILIEKNTNFLDAKGMVWKNTIPLSTMEWRCMRMNYEKICKKSNRQETFKEAELITLIAEIGTVTKFSPINIHRIWRLQNHVQLIFYHLNIPTNGDNKDNDEYTPYTLNTKNKLLKYWSNTLLSLNFFW